MHESNKQTISIVTINYNESSNLQETLSSIDSAVGNDFVEVIVIDGASKDGSMDVVSDYSMLVTHSLSEADNGIYDAMNKGVALATGDSIIFINSGDKINNSFKFDEFYIWVKNNSINLEEESVISDVMIYIDASNYYKKTVNNDSSDWYYENLPSHQCVFAPRCFLKLNKFDTNLKVSADSEVLIKLFSSTKCKKYKKIISNFYLGGASNNWATINELFNNLAEIRETRDLSILPFINLSFKGLLKFIIIKSIGYKKYYKAMMFFKGL
jgi:glycosyltransferase involved in cell wall biosynthesis